MAENKKRAKLPTFVSPKGTAVYPKLHTPDTKFDADGVYSVRLEVPTDDAKAFCELIDKQQAASLVKAKEENKGKKVKEADLPYSFKTDSDGNVDESITVFRFKLKAQVKPKEGEGWTQKPVIFDAKNKPMTEKVGGGSILKVAGELVPFYTAMVGAGVTLRMRAVQVLDLKSFGERDAKSYGFEEEEGGFEGTGFPEENSIAAKHAEDDGKGDDQPDTTDGSDF